MVVDELPDEQADRIFQALSDRTRRNIVLRVLAAPTSVSLLARHYSMSFAAVQKHVAVLERAGLVTKERHGREQLVRGDPATVRRASVLLERYEQLWRDRHERMTELITDHDLTDSWKDRS